MSMTQIIALREKRAQKWDAAKAFLNAKTGADGTMAAEDAAAYDRMEAEVVNLGDEIARLERQQNLDEQLNQPTRDALHGAKPGQTEEEQKRPRATDAYRSAFWTNLRNKSIKHEVYDALQVGQDSEGGYLAPDEYQKTLIDALQEQNIFRPLANVIQTESGERKIPVVASHGTAAWIDEEGSYPESDDAFGQVSIGSYKLATMIKVSEELLNDSAFDVPA